jgi:hypothetical protein
MLKFEFSDSDCKPDVEEPDSQYANITIKWRGEIGDIDNMMMRFKSFLLALTFHEDNVKRIVYLEKDEWDLLRAKNLLQDGEDVEDR